MKRNFEIFTIGHSTRDIEAFIDLLNIYKIELLVDIRHFPGSRKYPHFNKESLQESLARIGVKYKHLLGLGGRRKIRKDSHNTRWRNDSFRSYADYMETEEFKKAIMTLEELGEKYRTAYMCSEAVWWRCHRSMVSDYLKVKGWKVMHIMSATKLEEHPYTSPARIVNNKVVYYDDNLFHD